VLFFHLAEADGGVGRAQGDRSLVHRANRLAQLPCVSVLRLSEFGQPHGRRRDAWGALLARRRLKAALRRRRTLDRLEQPSQLVMGAGGERVVREIGAALERAPGRFVLALPHLQLAKLERRARMPERGAGRQGASRARDVLSCNQYITERRRGVGRPTLECGPQVRCALRQEGLCLVVRERVRRELRLRPQHPPQELG
jgi:hypothetical protein